MRIQSNELKLYFIVCYIISFQLAKKLAARREFITKPSVQTETKMLGAHHLKFTQAAVERIPPPPHGRVTYWDSLLPGFGVRVSAPRRGGHVCKAWVCTYRVNSKLVFETIGKMIKIKTVEEARERARESMRIAVKSRSDRAIKERPVAPAPGGD
jgi:hypothetical protein